MAEGVTRRGSSLGVAGALADLSDGGRVPVLQHVNNLENPRDADLAKAATLIRNLRDHLLIPGGHWPFVGKTGVTRDVFDAREEVGSIMAQSVALPSGCSRVLRAGARRAERAGGRAAFTAESL